MSAKLFAGWKSSNIQIKPSLELNDLSKSDNELLDTFFMWAKVKRSKWICNEKHFLKSLLVCIQNLVKFCHFPKQQSPYFVYGKDGTFISDRPKCGGDCVQPNQEGSRRLAAML